MRRRDREITDIETIEKIIADAKYLHLGMFDDEYPYVVPLHYGYRTENRKITFYIHCAKSGHKIDCIRKNNNVFVQIDCDESLIAADTACEYGAAYKCVMCRGKATIVDDACEKSRALSLLMKTQTGKDFAFTESIADAVMVVRIDAESYTAKIHEK